MITFKRTKQRVKCDKNMFQVSWISKYFWSIVLVNTGKGLFCIQTPVGWNIAGAGSKDLVPVSTSISSTNQGLNCSLCDMRCVLLHFHTATQQGIVTPSWGEPHHSQPTEKQQQPWSPNDTDRRLNCAGAQRELLFKVHLISMANITKSLGWVWVGPQKYFYFSKMAQFVCRRVSKPEGPG